MQPEERSALTVGLGDPKAVPQGSLCLGQLLGSFLSPVQRTSLLHPRTEPEMMHSGATIIHGTNAPGALLREDAWWWEMPPPQTKRQCVHTEPPISSETTDTKPQSRYRRFQPLWEPTGVVGPILPSPRFAGEGFQRCAGTDPGYHPLAGAYLPAQLLAVLLSHCCRAGGGGWLCCPHAPSHGIHACPWECWAGEVGGVARRG